MAEFYSRAFDRPWEPKTKTRKSPAVEAVLELDEQVAPTAAVLIQGETGTGKS
jgi:DNA-binding NtrC family response regulator